MHISLTDLFSEFAIDPDIVMHLEHKPHIIFHCVTDVLVFLSFMQAGAC